MQDPVANRNSKKILIKVLNFRVRGKTMKVVILCGGDGARLKDASETSPKPMLFIGDRPIVWHIMKYYASFGYTQFLLCLGYKSEYFIDYFLNYRSRNSDCTISLANMGEIRFHNHSSEQDWEITLVHTGFSAMTGCRLYRAAKYIQEENFFLTYGDGLSDINLHQLVSFHLEHKKLVALSAVHPSGRFGEIHLDKNKVLQFNEKFETNAGYINGGFMVMQRAFIHQYLDDDPNLSLEQVPFSRAVQDGNVFAYRHDGFWQCMDTSREYKLLNQLWEQNQAPWKRW